MTEKWIDDRKIPIPFLEPGNKTVRHRGVSNSHCISHLDHYYFWIFSQSYFLSMKRFTNNTFIFRNNTYTSRIALQEKPSDCSPDKSLPTVPCVVILLFWNFFLFLLQLQNPWERIVWISFLIHHKTRSDNSKHTLIHAHLLKSHCSQTGPELKNWFMCFKLHFSTSWKHQLPASKRMKLICFMKNPCKADFFLFFCLRLKHILKEYLIKRVQL